jgi:hypothetical protein
MYFCHNKFKYRGVQLTAYLHLTLKLAKNEAAHLLPPDAFMPQTRQLYNLSVFTAWRG